MTDPRDTLARRLGVVPDYLDQTGTRHELSAETRDALLRAMDAPDTPAEASRLLERLDAEEAARAMPLWTICATGGPSDIPSLDGCDWTLSFEGGASRRGTGRNLGEVPLGIHEIRSGRSRGWLLAAPASLPEPTRGWGVTLPLYGLAADGALGSYRDLRMAVRSLGRAGADFVGINPIHAGFPTDPDAISPYSPSHRGRLSVRHIHAAGQDAVPPADLLDYARAGRVQDAALAAEWAAFDGSDFDRWFAAAGEDLHRFALHQTLSDRFGAYWPDWPASYRAPDTPEARAFAADNPDRMRFHAWLQWRAERQLAQVQEAADEAGMAFGLYLDLAVGTHPAGAETWGQPDLFARGVSLGAPPDAFSSEGQSWGLAPLRPDTLAGDGFRPLARILRRQFQVARLLRIDHILGFERAFWVPKEDGVPGAYVTMPRDALLAVARMEAERVGGTVVGEDLGNIPGGLQTALADAGILGCRVAQFEQDWEADSPAFLPARDYARAALTSFSTHDLPTWEGWKRGRDLDWRRDLGALGAAEHEAAMAQRRAEVAALTDRVGGSGVEDIHAFLAATPSRLLALQLEDILGRIEQPNLPGTTAEHPNWRRPVGVAPDTLGRLDVVRRTATLMRDAER